MLNSYTNPNARPLQKSLNTLIFRTFSTNFTALAPHQLDSQADDDNRVAIPISDTRAHMPIYVNYLVSNRQSLMPLFKQFEAAWPANLKHTSTS